MPTPPAPCVTRTPKLFYYNPETNTQVQEYLPNAVNLKTYALEHFKAPTSESFKPQCRELGHALGVWLRTFHDWSQKQNQTALKKILANNKEMQQIKFWINYQAVVGMVDQHSDIPSNFFHELPLGHDEAMCASQMHVEARCCHWLQTTCDETRPVLLGDVNDKRGALWLRLRLKGSKTCCTR